MASTAQQPSSSSTKASSGAISLLDKYASINSGIEDARRQTNQIRSKLEAIQTEAHRLRDDRDDMVRETKQAQRDMEKINAQLSEASTLFDNRSKEKADAEKSRDDARRTLGQAQRYADEERRAFLERCRQFRTTCKRLRLAASTASLSDRHDSFANTQKSASMQPSFSEEDDSSDSEAERDQTESNMPADVESDGDGEGRSSREGTASISSIADEAGKGANDIAGLFPDTKLSHRSRRVKGSDRAKGRRDSRCIRSKKDVDPEMWEAEERERESLDARAEAKRGLDDAIVDRDAAARRSDDRARKLEQQRSQLERVRQDVAEMEKELEAVQQETKEAREMGENFAKDVCRRKREKLNRTVRSSFSSQFNPPPELGGTNHYTTPPPPNGSSVTPSPHTYNYGGRNVQNHKTNSQGKPEAYNQTSSCTSYGVSNPYRSNNNGSFSGASNNPYDSSSVPQRKSKNAPPYASTLLQDDREGTRLQYHGGGRQVNSLERQHPHRGGRIREHRQFGTALEITSTYESNISNSTEESNGIVDGPTTSNEVENIRGRANMNTKASHLKTLGSAISQRKHAIEDEDDDDDDDELLSFVAFGARKK